MRECARVVQVGSLEGFGLEVPARDGQRVYLELSEQGIPGQMPRKRVVVELFGVNESQEIVWLYNCQVVCWIGGQPFGRDAAIWKGMRRMYELVKAHLEGLGYEVREGRYGVPRSIEPTRGGFECVRWVTGEDGEFHVEAVEG